MENDLICRGELLRKVQPDDESDEKAKISVKTAKNMMRTLTKSVPAVDAVIPVRCKDCKHKCETEDGEYNPVDIVCDYWSTDGLKYWDFCSYGERRADDAD